MTQHEVDQLQHELKELIDKWNLGHSILVTTCNENENTLDTLVLILKRKEKKVNRRIVMIDKITTSLSKVSETLN